MSVVEGMHINPEEEECPGWNEVARKKKKLAERADCNTGNAPTSAKGSGNGSSRTAASQNVLRRVVKASRIPNLPRDHFKTITRPRGGMDVGMDVKKTDLLIFKHSLAKAASLTAKQVFDDMLSTNPFQKIFVAATPFEKNACAYARVQEMSMGETVIGLAAYVVASDDTYRGVICGINVDLSDAELTEMIVNRRNPDALRVRRIKKTPTVIVLFDGQKHRNMSCVIVLDTRVPCITGMWTRAMRVVIWATGSMFAPRAMTKRNAADAACSHRHRIISVIPRVPSVAEHTQRLTGKCRKRFQVPYIVRRRRRRRRRRARRGSDTAGGEEAMAEEEPFSRPHHSRSASRGRSGSKSRSHSRGRDKGSRRFRSRGRSGSKGRVQKQMSLADKARMNMPSGQEVTQGILPEQKKRPIRDFNA
ncbi:hypothetical protein HPB52_005042 [Rhipicephalus sanguineus]|uniref:Uncharacterized protein n=1 Tax=Rhipicephalus sanguineus TaxID=34632 RepID=A0A9D4Q9Q9_RHISA|nr:hypothetical protein HPB52_005042 [Rhipicephalus sanguineus]